MSHPGTISFKFDLGATKMTQHEFDEGSTGTPKHFIHRHGRLQATTLFPLRLLLPHKVVFYGNIRNFFFQRSQLLIKHERLFLMFFDSSLIYGTIALFHYEFDLFKYN